MQNRSLPAIRTTHLGHSIIECVLLTGTRSAEGIMASGHGYRANRPNTWLLRPTLQVKILLANPEPMVWTPPLPGGGIPERQPLKGECHADRSYWIRSSQIYFRGSRSGCAREGRAPEDLASQCRVEPLCQPSTVSDWHGSVEWRPLLGKGTFRVRSPGPADQPPVRGTLRQVQQKRSQRC